MAGQVRYALLRTEPGRIAWRLLNYCEYRDAPLGPYMGAMAKTMVTYKGPAL